MKHDIANLTAAEIASKYKVSNKTALRWLEKSGLRQPRQRIGLEKAKEIRNLSATTAVKDLAIRYKVSLASIYRILKQVTYKEQITRTSGQATINCQYSDNANMKFRIAHYSKQ